MVDYIEGVQSNGAPLPNDRDNPNKAVGAPEDSDTYNFVTLGYGGSIILGFENDVVSFQIIETSFGK